MPKNKLKCETDTPAMQRKVTAAFRSWDGGRHQNLQTNFEHGQWFVTCLTCSRQWSVNDAEGGDSVDGFSFEEVSEGDGYCDSPKSHRK